MLFFVLGLFLGSLLNNIAYRLVREENFIFGYSKCDFCKKRLNWYELIPIVSYLIQGGKCYSCQAKISFRYPLVELITGLFVYRIADKTLLLAKLNLINFIFFLYFLTIVSLILILALYDLETFYVQEKVVYFGIFVWLIFIFIFNYYMFPKIDFVGNLNYLIYLPQNDIKDYALNRLYFAYILALIILIIFIFTLGKGIGLGDAKIFFILGLYFNFGDIIFSLILTILIGGIFSLILLINKRKFKQPIPFVPFIFTGLFLIIMFGDLLANFLFNRFINLG